MPDHLCLPYACAYNIYRSTHNTRIERSWVEVGREFARAWRAFFYQLEDLHNLDAFNPHHLWLLHILFMAEVQEDCRRFQETWNHKPISGAGHDQTPLVRRVL